MLSLSQTTGYAILALGCIENSGPDWVMARQVADCTGIPLPYLSKMMHAMGDSGLIKAKRGYKGGFRLARPAKRITMLEIAEAVDGKHWSPCCLLGLEDCSDLRACPTHKFWKKQRQAIEAELRRLTLHDVAKFEMKKGSRLRQCGCESAGRTKQQRLTTRS